MDQSAQHEEHACSHPPQLQIVHKASSLVRHASHKDGDQTRAVSYDLGSKLLEEGQTTDEIDFENSLWECPDDLKCEHIPSVLRLNYLIHDLDCSQLPSKSDDMPGKWNIMHLSYHTQHII